MVSTDATAYTTKSTTDEAIENGFALSSEAGQGVFYIHLECRAGGHSENGYRHHSFSAAPSVGVYHTVVILSVARVSERSRRTDARYCTVQL